MGQKSKKGTVQISNCSGRIRLRWTYRFKRYSLNHSPYTKQNLQIVKKVILEIERDMVLGIFDTTLSKYTGRDQTVPIRKAFWQNYEIWVKNYLNMDCDLHINHHAFRNMIKKWGEVTEHNVLNKFNSLKLSPCTYNRRLKVLKDFIEWLVKRKIWTENIVLDVRPRRVVKIENRKRKPFTSEEIKKVLDAFKNDTFSSHISNMKHSHYYPFLYFLFKTGVRNSEAIGLRVGKIDFNKKVIVIDEVMARTVKGTNSKERVRKETKNGKVRLLPLTDDLIAVLSPLLNNKHFDDLVFTSKMGLPIDDHKFQRRIFKPVLNKLGIEERVLYACRHTFGSRCIDQGLSPVMTAFLMGNNPETALRNYTHQISLPKNLPSI